MNCTFRKIFGNQLCGTSCSGELVQLCTLQTSVSQYLAQHDCLKRGTDYTAAELILNRVSPDYIAIDRVGSVDICEYHRKSLFSIKAQDRRLAVLVVVPKQGKLRVECHLKYHITCITLMVNMLLLGLVSVMNTIH